MKIAEYLRSKTSKYLLKVAFLALERLRFPASLWSLIILMPELRVTAIPEFKSISVDGVVNWSDWNANKPCDHVVSGWQPDSWGYSKCNIQIQAFQNFVCAHTIQNWRCDIQELEGFSNSKSNLFDFDSLNKMVAINSQEMINPITQEKLKENLAHKEIRIIHAKSAGDYFHRYAWDGRVFLINSGGSHHLAAARYIASRLHKKVPLEGKLSNHQLNPEAVNALCDDFYVFIIPSAYVVTSGFKNAMKSFGATYYWRPMPRPLHKDYRAIFLPKKEKLSLIVAESLIQAKCLELGEYLISLCSFQLDNERSFNYLNSIQLPAKND